MKLTTAILSEHNRSRLLFFGKLATWPLLAPRDAITNNFSREGYMCRTFRLDLTEASCRSVWMPMLLLPQSSRPAGERRYIRLVSVIVSVIVSDYNRVSYSLSCIVYTHKVPSRAIDWSLVVNKPVKTKNLVSVIVLVIVSVTLFTHKFPSRAIDWSLVINQPIKTKNYSLSYSLSDSVSYCHSYSLSYNLRYSISYSVNKSFS